MITGASNSQFHETVWAFYAEHARDDLPWRIQEPDGSFDPYKIMVSEIMLQQTQVSRVVPKYQEWIQVFPDVATLAGSSLKQVLELWLGLGYNRRAKFLYEAAQLLAAEAHPQFPNTISGLVKLPGIGKNTAGAIMAYAYNQPITFIETNIRTVYIHHYFSEREAVTDSEILEIAQQTLNTEHPREWYWALMDYGVYLKKIHGNPARRSAMYTKQSPFEGSNRQVRARILHTLATGPKSIFELQTIIDDQRCTGLVQVLVAEGFIEVADGYYAITGHKMV